MANSKKRNATPNPLQILSRLYPLPPSESAMELLTEVQAEIGAPFADWGLEEWKRAALILALRLEFEKANSYRHHLAEAIRAAGKELSRPRGRPKGTGKHDPELWRSIGESIDAQVAAERASGRASTRKSVLERDLKAMAAENGQTLSRAALTKTVNAWTKNISRFRSK